MISIAVVIIVIVVIVYHHRIVITITPVVVMIGMINANRHYRKRGIIGRIISVVVRGNIRHINR